MPSYESESLVHDVGDPGLVTFPSADWSNFDRIQTLKLMNECVPD